MSVKRPNVVKSAMADSQRRLLNTASFYRERVLWLANVCPCQGAGSASWQGEVHVRCCPEATMQAMRRSLGVNSVKAGAALMPGLKRVSGVLANSIFDWCEEQWQELVFGIPGVTETRESNCREEPIAERNKGSF